MSLARGCFQLLFVTSFSLFPLTSCTMCSSEPQRSAPSTTSEASPIPVSPPSEPLELKIEVLKEGAGTTTAVSGKKLTVHYTGRLTDGKVFDSSEQRQAPFSFILGAGQVIQGWERGITGMKIGGRRKFTIPASLAYGDKGVGNVIPPKATLIFEVELLNVE